MTKKYKYTVDGAGKFNKHGIDLVIYGQIEPSANVCHVSVQKGHFQEFYDVKSAFTYYIIKGEGTFMLDDEPVKVKATDLVVIPPNTRIYYFGNMEMVLTVSPAWEEKNERHVRFIDESESPYKA
jgi:mannose-6-phosphate isomerase-like protein (cupin superfamily)